MTKHEIVPEGRKQWTDRDLLRSCLDAMKVSQQQAAPTDWRHMIAAIDAHLAVEPPAPQTPKGAAEVVFDEAGNVLWVERYVFARIHGKGEDFIRDRKEYLVTDSGITQGKHGGVLVEHVVRLIADSSPPNRTCD